MQGVVKSAASRKDLATKGDIQDVRNEIAATKHEILKWVPGIALAQTAVIVTVLGAAIAVFLR